MPRHWIPPARFWPLLRQAATGWVEDGASSMGAALAYYTLFSIAPLLLLVIALAFLTFVPGAVLWFQWLMLAQLGVRRLSAGGAIALAAMGLIKRLAHHFLVEGSSPALFVESFPYADGNALFSSVQPRIKEGT